MWETPVEHGSLFFRLGSFVFFVSNSTQHEQPFLLYPQRTRHLLRSDPPQPVLILFANTKPRKNPAKDPAVALQFAIELAKFSYFHWLPSNLHLERSVQMPSIPPTHTAIGPFPMDTFVTPNLQGHSVFWILRDAANPHAIRMVFKAVHTSIPRYILAHCADLRFERNRVFLDYRYPHEVMSNHARGRIPLGTPSGRPVAPAERTSIRV